MIQCSFEFKMFAAPYPNPESEKYKDWERMEGSVVEDVEYHIIDLPIVPQIGMSVSADMLYKVFGLTLAQYQHIECENYQFYKIIDVVIYPECLHLVIQHPEYEKAGTFE